MKWSWRLGKLSGIDVRVHGTFVLLLAWIAVSSYLNERDVVAAGAGVLFVVAVFGSVLLHELGHARMAQWFGIRTRDITLLPIGGIARMERIPDKPGQELLVALAGPAVNVAIAAALGLALVATGRAATIVPADAGSATFFARLLWVNVSLAIFNLIPAFPMDGGRALRALLAFGGDYVKATRAAATLGRAIAIVLGFVGVLYNPILVFIAVFVWLGAGAEAGGVEAKASLHGLPVSAAMQTDFRLLRDDDTLDLAVRRLLEGAQVDFPVVDARGALVGVLRSQDLVAGMSRQGPLAFVGSAMDRRLVTAHPAEPLDVAFARFDEHGCRSMPVVVDGRVVGLLTIDNVGELLMLREAFDRATHRLPVARTA